MAIIDLGDISLTEDSRHVDLKQAALRVRPVKLDTQILTPIATPEQSSPAQEEAMAGKKVFSLERPDDKAREVAAGLTLEEQVSWPVHTRKSCPKFFNLE